MTSTVFEIWEFSPIHADNTPLGIFRIEYSTHFKTIVSMWDVSNPSVDLLIRTKDQDPIVFSFYKRNKFNANTETVNQLDDGMSFKATNLLASKYPPVTAGTGVGVYYDSGANTCVLVYRNGASNAEQQFKSPCNFTFISSRTVAHTFTTGQLQVVPVIGAPSTTLNVVYDQYGFAWSVKDSTTPGTELLVNISSAGTYSQNNGPVNWGTNVFALDGNGLCFLRPSSFTPSTFTGSNRFLLRLDLETPTNAALILNSTDNGASSWTDNRVSSLTTILSVDLNPICFGEETTLLNDMNEFIPIKSVQVGTVLQTFIHGPKVVKYVETYKFTPRGGNHVFSNMYLHKPSGVVLTGTHSVLVDSVPSHVESLYDQVQLTITCVDGKRLLHCPFVPGFQRMGDMSPRTIYSLVLEDEDPGRMFGVFTNGGLLLCETTSIRNHDLLSAQTKTFVPEPVAPHTEVCV